MSTLFEDRNIPGKSHPDRLQPVNAIVLHVNCALEGLDDGDGRGEAVSCYLMLGELQASYHSVVDTDGVSRICPYSWTAFHCAGLNSRSLGLAIPAGGDDWADMHPGRIEATMRHATKEAAAMSAWVEAEYGEPVPAGRITVEEAAAGTMGFVAHGSGDGFDWGQFFALYREASGNVPSYSDWSADQ